jgi:Ca2+-binding RTX toxin-like protein
MSVEYRPHRDGSVTIKGVYFYDEQFQHLVDWERLSLYVTKAEWNSDHADWRSNGFNKSDTILGNRFDDIIKSGGGSDKIKGKAGNDRIDGQRGDDILFGNAGDDTLFGGAGTDRYIGGGGYDHFVFRTVTDAGRGRKCDVIADFDLRRDYVTLSAIDANTDQAGNQAFEFIGRAGFTGDAGEVRCRAGIVSGDVDGDGIANFHISVGVEMREIDFVL